jgi:hypothetical protein
VTQLSAMALNQSPRAMALVFTTELVTLRRIVPRRRPVTHSGDFGASEQLKLPHGTIIPWAGRKGQTGLVVDHAKLEVPNTIC